MSFIKKQALLVRQDLPKMFQKTKHLNWCKSVRNYLIFFAEKAFLSQTIFFAIVEKATTRKIDDFKQKILSYQSKNIKFK